MFLQSGPLFLQASRKPSPYPPLPFHLLRLALCLSALICAAVLIFFVDHLRDEGYSIPWTFILLLTTSLLSLLHLFVSTYIHTTRTSTPSNLLIANLTLTLCWLVSLSVLTRNLGWTLGHHCALRTWHNEAGIMVCRLYKALTAFAVTGAAASIAAALLDLRVLRRSRDRGFYNQMDDDSKSQAVVAVAAKDNNNNSRGGGGGERGGSKGGFADAQELQMYGHGEGWERRSHEGARAYKLQKPIEAKQFGYEMPSEQTTYAGGNAY